MQVLCLEDVIKSQCCLRKTSKTELHVLAEYGKFDSEWFSRVVWSDESRFQLHADLQRGVFEDLVRNTIVNASLPQLSMKEEVSWCGEPASAAGTGELLHCEK